VVQGRQRPEPDRRPLLTSDRTGPHITLGVALPGSAYPTPWGSLCFTPAPVAPDPARFTLASTYGFLPGLLPATQAPWTYSHPGLGIPLSFSLQGLIVDAPTATNAIGVTNLVRVRVQ